jgi:flagellin
MTNSIITNISAQNAQGNIGRASNNASSSIARLSSGNRIVRASDDVAGLATGTALRTQVTTLRTALANASQGTSLLQVADGGLSQIVDILQRQRAIAAQASSGQLTDSNRSLLNQEFASLTAEIDRIAISTNFNGVSLLSGSLGTRTALTRTDANAAAAVLAAPTLGGAAAVASTVTVQAFNTATGSAVLSNTLTGAAGGIQLVDAANTLLANTAYLGVDASIYGTFTSFSFSNVSFGATTAGSADLTVELNGVSYTGRVTGAATDGVVTVSNGTNNIRLGLGTVNFADQASTDSTRATIADAFSTVSIARTYNVSGADFVGTSLEGVIGTAANGVATARLNNGGALSISNFQYQGSTGAANTSILTVQINGQTFTSTGVDDSITAGGSLQFLDSTGTQTFTINTTGLTNAITNIRTDLSDRANFISALNQGFARAGGDGLNFTVGSATTDVINVNVGSAATNSIFGGQSLNVTSAANAQAAANVINNAITTVTSLRATVGALQSRFNFAANTIQSSIENQDSARSSLLDTDVSAESTLYASAQVQLQAGIAVLAQANQLPQGLLKLLG